MRWTSRAISLSFSRSGPTALPWPVTRRNGGPWAILASFNQVWSVTTGQVPSLEPRPTSTSRQPVLPRKGDDHPLIEDFDPAAAVLGLVATDVQPDDLGASQAAGEADEQHGPVPKTPERPALERLEHGNDVLGQDGLFLARRGGVGVADAGKHGRDVAIFAIQRRAALRIGPG